MNTTISAIEAAITAFLHERGVLEPVVNLEKPVDFKFGDIATSVALKYAKQLQDNPVAIAEAICAHLLDAQIAAIAGATVAKPGFINITLSPTFFSTLLADIAAAGAAYGTNTQLAGQKWVIEHTSPNPNKAMHLGHLRNNLVGMSLVRLLVASGATVTSDAVDNNRGIAIAKMMWGFLAFMKKDDAAPTDAAYWATHEDAWFTPAEKDMLPDIFVTQCYILGETDFKGSPLIEEQVRGFVVAWEAGDATMWKLWEHMLSYAYAGMERTLARLGNHWDKVWHEHEHYKAGKEYVQKGLETGVFKTLDDGAVLTDLASYGIPDTILLKNDGTSLYITQDIALTALKKDFYQADKLIWVIGPEQSMAMKQLFAICEQLGIGAVSDFSHVPYGYVGLRDENGAFKKMSSRAGTVVLIDDVLDTVKEQIVERQNAEVALGHKEQLDSNDDLAEKLALAAVKFSILKSDRSQDLVFDPEQSIATTGDSGVYVMYTYTRTKSILRKKGEYSAPTSVFALGSEADVLRQLLYYPDVIARSEADLSVHHICQYLLELSSTFNAWYAKEIVLDGSDREDYKLAVTKAVGDTIKNGLAILGIDVIESM